MAERRAGASAGRYHVTVVANPAAGRGKARRLIPKVDALLSELRVRHRVVASKDAHDAERLAREAASGGSAIVAALGGDGQVGAVANGLAGTGAALALVPAGTGNDFARHLGLDRSDPLAAVTRLADPSFAQIDLVKVTTPQRERLYVNIGGAGFDSEVNAHANRIRRLKGTPKYIVSTFVTLARFRAGDFTIEIDGIVRDHRAMMIAVGNGSSYGGGMKVTPTARADSGVLEVCVVGEVPKLEFVRTFPKVFKGTHVDHPKVTMMRGREIHVTASGGFQVFADGEHVGTLPATFLVQPAALRVVAPVSFSLGRRTPA